MVVKKKHDGSKLYVKLIGELDECSAGYVRTVLDDLFLIESYSSVIFDLCELEFMDSTGIGVFIGRYKLLKNRNVPVYILNPQRQIEKIFMMSGIYEIMPKIS